MPDPDTDDQNARGRDAAPDEGYVEDQPEDAYDPSDIEVNRGRMQGLGVGARDLARQGDPDRDLASDLDLDLPGNAGADPNDTGS
jgi:hypothetical protein